MEGTPKAMSHVPDVARYTLGNNVSKDIFDVFRVVKKDTSKMIVLKIKRHHRLGIE